MAWPLRYCPDCGAAMPAPIERFFAQCSACGARHWCNAKPCAGALLVRAGRLLLARRALPPRQGAWDIVGGFLEPDETPEAGALREVREETGLACRITRLIGLYPDSYGEDGTYTLNIYFEAAAPDGEPRAQSDVAELRWFAPDELPDDLAFPHEHVVLDHWRALRADVPASPVAERDNREL